MKINDELLSGFLDAELPDTQMQEIRDLLAEDDQLVERLAELAQVDHWVAQHAAQIDQQPVPAAINELLAAPESVHTGKVVELSLWRKINKAATRHAALAAGVAIFFGISMNNWLQNENNAVPVQVANVLTNYTSGQTIATDDGIEVKPYFSFENNQGQYCRHYQLKQAEGATANVACREENQWRLVASVKNESGDIQGQYQAASGESQMVDIIDNMSNGSVFDLAQENAAISKSWQAKNK